jgi:hypothetical protein
MLSKKGQDMSPTPFTALGKGMMKGMSSAVGKGMSSKKGKGSTPPAPSTAIYVRQRSADLEIVSCSASSVEVRGSQSANLVAGSLLLFMQDGDGAKCSPYNPLFRKVASTSPSSNGTTTVATVFATVGDILGPVSGSAIANDPLEPMAGCSHTTSNVTVPRKLQELPGVDDARLGECKASWLVKNKDGRCTHTNCFVGTTGDPSNCFNCVGNCDNGCGPAAVPLLNSDGNFGDFDFGSACCNHDYCWSSTRGKNLCDADFYTEMTAKCASLPKLAFVGLLLPIGPSVAAFARCELMAIAFYLGVKFPTVAQSAYNSAQLEQKKYEQSAACAAQCPSTQTSGGQGTTVLAINLLKASGTFPVSYEMYQIPDQLYITYEGTRIFDTGGLVSGSRKVNVTYSGSSTLILVTLFAPNSGTAWDISIGCPF